MEKPIGETGGLWDLEGLKGGCTCKQKFCIWGYRSGIRALTSSHGSLNLGIFKLLFQNQKIRKIQLKGLTNSKLVPIRPASARWAFVKIHPKRKREESLLFHLLLLRFLLQILLLEYSLDRGDHSQNSQRLEVYL